MKDETAKALLEAKDIEIQELQAELEDKKDIILQYEIELADSQNQIARLQELFDLD